MKTDTTIPAEMLKTFPPSVLTKRQVKHYGPKPVRGYGAGGAIVAQVRYDDQCGNGHNTFSITAEVRTNESRRHNDIAAGGCMHEEIAKSFPELAPFLKWHLTSTDAPMHYLANTLYHASERDHWGCLKGEPHQWSKVLKFHCSPIEWTAPNWINEDFLSWVATQSPDYFTEDKIRALEHVNGPKESYKFGPKYTVKPDVEKWHECEFDSKREALQWCEAARQGYTVRSVESAWGEGKARELNHARSAAVWPEATDAELSAEPEDLRRVLLARLPKLMADFKTAVESLGFVY
jgi:hypothetical protein